MFDITYLGHQGWLIESGTTRVLLDALLSEGVGDMPDDVVAVYPPRRLDLATFPAIDAVIASHEHPDHLSIPSLLRIDRRARALLPARSSAAARHLLEELGFPTTPMQSGEVIAIGDLEIHPFHSTELTRDEWDVTPMMIRDRSGDGSFATSIDAPESPAFARFAQERAGRIGLWASSHNHMDLFMVQEGATQQRQEDMTAHLAREMIHRAQASFRGMQSPEVLAVLTSGFTFERDLSWLNRHVFPGAAEHLAPVVARGLPGLTVRAPLPGNCFSFLEGKLSGVVTERSFLGTLDRQQWPPHGGEPHVGSIPDYGPASGRRELSADDLAALLDELRAFAAHLYGGRLFSALYTSGAEPVSRRRVDVGFAARTASTTLALAYRPEACAFELLSNSESRGGMVAGLECWASDLLAVLRVEMQSGYLLAGRYRRWGLPHGMPGLDTELMTYCHALRQPNRTLEQYRRAAAVLGDRLASSPSAVDRVKWAGP